MTGDSGEYTRANVRLGDLLVAVMTHPGLDGSPKRVLAQEFTFAAVTVGYSHRQLARYLLIDQSEVVMLHRTAVEERRRDGGVACGNSMLGELLELARQHCAAMEEMTARRKAAASPPGGEDSSAVATEWLPMSHVAERLGITDADGKNRFGFRVRYAIGEKDEAIRTKTNDDGRVLYALEDVAAWHRANPSGRRG